MNKILLIDDEPHMLKLLERIITEKTTYGTVSTNSSLEVPQIIEKRNFDLIITDLRMPGMDGMDILNLINEKKRWEKVIMITAFGSIDIALEAQNKGAFDYITKPFKKEQIVFVIERAMTYQDVRRQLKEYDQILECEPYDEAMLKFRQKYIRKISGKYGNDIQAISDKTNIPSDEIAKILGIETK